MIRLSVVASLLATTVMANASAPPCDPANTASRRPMILLRASGLDEAIAASVGEHLLRDFGRRGIGLCIEAPSPQAQAPTKNTVVLELSSSTSDAVSVTVVVQDAITNKRVSRDVDVRALPPDARALAIAQAADELVRASWAEVLIEGSAKGLGDVPSEVNAAVVAPRSETPPAPATRSTPKLELGVGAATEIFSTGYAQLGPDLAVAFFPFKRFGAIAHGGLRSSFASRDRGPGTLDVSALAGALTIAVRTPLSTSGRVGIDVGPTLSVTRLSFDGAPKQGFVSREAAVATAIYGSVDARAWIVIAKPLLAALSLSAGAPIQTARALGPPSGATPNVVLLHVGGAVIGTRLVVEWAW